MSIITSFIAGIGVSFTPCVYPLIPVTIGIIGGITKGDKKKAFIGSIIYSLGIAFTYTILGIIAGVFGKIFGFIQTNPYVNLFVGIFLIIFSLSFFNVYQFPLLNLSKKSITPTSLFSLFIVGILSGLVISPCTTPVLGSILVIAASKGDIIKAGLLLFFFAIGMCFTIIIAGTFSSILPRKGKWLHITERIFGFILIGGGIYFILNFWRFR
ncbi:MAG: hypothetical protein DRI36_03530 [Caldiserica bacterium]|nr:MAG: hypothetical protein DRI36_03530 [Caldisericota bacterium]